MNQPEPQSLPFPTLISDIEKGLVKIPQFQRDFVWTKEKSALLLDSMLKGFPIGTFILWKTKESLRAVRNLGGAKLPDTPKGDFTQYVLDGQQRLTSLYAAAKGLKVDREERTDDFGEIFVDLLAKADEQVVTIDTAGRKPGAFIRLTDLLNADFTFLAGYPDKFHKKLAEYQNRLRTYAFSIVLVKEAPLDVATEIFTRINVTGRPLSVFEIMVAKTFDAERSFDLADEYDKLMDRLQQAQYDVLPPATILQSVSSIIVKECSKKAILKLNKKKFIDVWPDAVEGICGAVDYFRTFYRIPVSRLLPYAALLVPFSYFFYHHPDRPSGEQLRFMQDFFWRVSLGGRYSYSLEARLAQDIRRIDDILAGKQPSYETPIDVSPEFVRQNGWFSTGRSYVKAILCLLAYKQPKSFVDDSAVIVSNDWLKRANSKNYHHFFPRAYLHKKGIDELDINNIANITIVDDFLNKRLIRDKAPSRYMRGFAKENPDLTRTMRSHLIKLDKFGVWENDYERFLRERCKAISRELSKRIVPQDIDELGQAVSTDDYEEAEYEEATAA
jgi:hypothetical protein